LSFRVETDLCRKPTRVYRSGSRRIDEIQIDNGLQQSQSIDRERIDNKSQQQ
jgi:hypothetical protein